MLLTDFDYELPEELIAQTPIEPRNASRLMVLHPSDKTIVYPLQFLLLSPRKLDLARVGSVFWLGASSQRSHLLSCGNPQPPLDISRPHIL